MLAVSTNLKILSRSLYHNFYRFKFIKLTTNYNQTRSCEYHTAQILQMISSPEKNDTAMHDDRLANQKSSFRDGSVIFIFLHTFRDLRSLSKWIYNFKYLCLDVMKVGLTCNLFL